MLGPAGSPSTAEHKPSTSAGGAPLSEAALWRRLCHWHLGVRVRRQHPLHPCIADFYVASHRLVIEVDGAVHASAEARAHDARRSAELGRLYGVRVMRLPAGLVERDVEAAVALVRAALG